ncbi:MAG: hypothetical protein RIT07_1019 [Bacteroidota bacterium]|jgi:tRNA U34 5-methylaminomethyl-2-thiouridine-forming methyltransferase MnmC
MKNAVNQTYFTLQQTPDGSYTFYDSYYQNHLHSINGALTESLYVYITHGLTLVQKEIIRIFEMGFGTGLNAYLTYQYAEKNCKRVYYHTIDVNPIPHSELPPPVFLKSNHVAVRVWENLTRAEWNTETRISDFFVIQKQIQNISDCELVNNLDLVFYDAYAPSVQPEVWTSVIFRNLFNALCPGGIIVTYSAAKAAKMAVYGAGFIMEKLPGPPGKRHMLRAIKPR